MRQLSEMLLARSRRWQRLIDTTERDGALIVEMLLGASIGHLPLRNPGPPYTWIGIEQALADGRPLSPFALARSMALPYHTTRRRMIALHAAGGLTRHGSGFLAAPIDGGSAALAALAREDADALGGVLAALAAGGYRPAAALLDAGFACIPPGVVERLLLGFALRALEHFTALYGDVLNGAISASLVALNVRHITRDAGLAKRFADDAMPPPDSLRRPISIRLLARTMQLPFETVRRRIAALLEAGKVVVVDGGYIVPSKILTNAAHRDYNRRLVAHFDRMLRELGDVTAISTSKRSSAGPGFAFEGKAGTTRPPTA